ncbi:MAG: VOC family protein [Alphaproteobacteria bacterium]|nr:VOC family protein [Alphaproteobacteria bacterium]
MIDHVSIGVRDLQANVAFYTAVLKEIGFTKLVERATTVGFGKRYAEFWLNHRAGLGVAGDNGVHVCLRTRHKAEVDGFWRAALAGGAKDQGAPGLRPEYTGNYYAAFIQDADGNKVEVVTFVE